MFALEEFIRVMDQINQRDTFNNFNLNFLNVPFDNSVEEVYISLLMVRIFIKECEKEAIWRNICSS
jgi:hypothetical protein